MNFFRYDVILNTVGQVLHEHCLKYCLPDGIVVTTASSQLASDSYGYVMGGLYSLFMRARYWFIKVRLAALYLTIPRFIYFFLFVGKFS